MTDFAAAAIAGEEAGAVTGDGVPSALSTWGRDSTDLQGTPAASAPLVSDRQSSHNADSTLQSKAFDMQHA